MALRVIYEPPQQGPQSEGPRKLLGSETLANVGTGLGKTFVGALKGAGTVGQSVLDRTINPAVEKVTGKTIGADVYRPNSLVGKNIDEVLKPQGTGEQVGAFAGDLALYAVPAFKVAKTERAINTLAEGIKNPIGQSLFRVGMKSAANAVGTGAVKYLQSGGDTQAALETAATAGVIRGGLGAVGETARALKLPERLYQTIFKNAKADMLDELNTEGIANLQKTKPEVFKQLVDSGVIKIKTGVSGEAVPFINKTTAEQALERGLKGNLKTMANEVVGKKYESEFALQNAVKTYTGTVDASEPQFKKVLDKIAVEYEDVGFGELSKEARALSSEIIKTKGQLPADTALRLRRFLDKMRFASSYDRPATSLSLTQSNLKTLTDTLRGRINKIPGVGKIMDDYSFYIDALDDIAKEAARQGNQQLVSMIDSIFLGAGLASTNPVAGFLAATTRRVVQNTAAKTYAAQALKNSATSPTGSALRGAISGSIPPSVEGQ